MAIRKIIYNSHFQISLFGLFSLLFILQGVDTEKYLLLSIPLLTVAFCLMLFRPSLILFLFICTFYIGDSLITRKMISVLAADIAFFILCAAFFSKLFTKGDLSFRLSDTKWKAAVTLLIFFIVSAFSVLLNVQKKEGIDILISLWYMFNLLQIFAVFLIFSHEKIAASREQYINLVLLLSVIEGAAALLQYFQTGDNSINTLRTITGTFSTHHAILGSMMVFPLALCIYRSTASRHLLGKIFYLSGGVLSFYIVVISGSRSSIVGIIASIVIWLFFGFSVTKKYLISIMVVGVVATVLFLFSPLRRLVIDTIKNSETSMLDISSYQRLIIWKEAFHQFAEASPLNKLFGIGIGNYYTMTYSFQMIEGFNWVSGAHNNYIHVLIETGIVGFFVFIFFFGFILAALWRRSTNDRLCRVLFYATLAFCFSGLTQETFWFQPAFCRFWMVYTTFLGICLSDHGRTTSLGDL
ncbi:MAG: O-antigen ligase family protein [Chitinispirillaceae bacterium]|nr:O-antigen ligase family protein [Chitinispirillaceae bacterium]